MIRLHKRFTDDQIAEFIHKYLRKEVERKHLQPILGINKIRLEETSLEKKLIEDKEVPIRPYDYSYIKDLLERDHK